MDCRGNEFLFAILTQVRDEGCKELKFDTYDLREYVEFDRTQPKRWNKNNDCSD